MKDDRLGFPLEADVALDLDLEALKAPGSSGCRKALGGTLPQVHPRRHRLEAQAGPLDMEHTPGGAEGATGEKLA